MHPWLLEWPTLAGAIGCGSRLRVRFRLTGSRSRFCLSRATYEAQLRGANVSLEAMPNHQLADQGKRFLLPWEWGWRMPPLVD